MKKDLYLSKSSIETFNQCELKFWNKYIKKETAIQTKESVQSSEFGTLIHKVLEEYDRSEKKVNILSIYNEEYKKSGINSLELYALGERRISDYAKETDLGHKILGLEVKFNLFTDNGVPLKGVMDKVVEIDKKTLGIKDYKTGYSTPLTEEEMKTDIQLGIYDLAGSILWPEYDEITLSLDYLHYGTVTCQRTKAQRETLKKYLEICYQRIMSSYITEERPEGRLNTYCHSCEYKNGCDKYKSTISKINDLEEAEQETNRLMVGDVGITIAFEELDAFHKMLKYKQSILKKFEKDLEGYILTYIKSTGNQSAVIGKTNYGISAKKYTNYDIGVVMELAKEKGINLSEVLDVKKMQVDKLLTGDPSAAAMLKGSAGHTYSKAYLKQ